MRRRGDALIRPRATRSAPSSYATPHLAQRRAYDGGGICTLVHTLAAWASYSASKAGVEMLAWPIARRSRLVSQSVWCTLVDRYRPRPGRLCGPFFVSGPAPAAALPGQRHDERRAVSRPMRPGICLRPIRVGGGGVAHGGPGLGVQADAGCRLARSARAISGECPARACATRARRRKSIRIRVISSGGTLWSYRRAS
jgi:hypothetical protein